MGTLIRTLVVLFLWIVPNLAQAVETLPAGFAEGRAGFSARVTDGDTLTLADGREVRLVGIQAPKLALGRAGFRPWPLAGAAKTALEEIVGDSKLRLYFGGARKDRHGRVLAHLVLGNDTWVQGALLARGMARVYSFPDNRTAVAEMLRLERRARRVCGVIDHHRVDVMRARGVKTGRIRPVGDDTHDLRRMCRHARRFDQRGHVRTATGYQDGDTLAIVHAPNSRSP